MSAAQELNSRIRRPRARRSRIDAQLNLADGEKVATVPKAARSNYKADIREIILDRSTVLENQTIMAGESSIRAGILRNLLTLQSE